MSDIQYALVPAGGTNVMTLNVDSTVHVAMRGMSDTLGLHWPNEFRRIMNDPILSKAVIKLITAFSNGQEVICLPLTHFHGWLFRLNLNTINEDARPIVEALQREGYDALHDYWVKGVARNHRAADRGYRERPITTRSLLAVYDRLKRSTDPAERTFLYSAMERENRQLDLPLPPIERIGREAQDPAELIAPLVEGLWTLTARGVTWDHARDNRRIAFNPREIGRLFDANDVDVQIDAAMRDALRRVGGQLKTVNSAIVGKAVHCWVLSRSTATLQ